MFCAEDKIFSYLKRKSIAKIVIENNRVILEFNDSRRIDGFIRFLYLLGVTTSVEKREIRIEYEPKFWDYLVKDRGLSEKTSRSYLNYMRKLSGKIIDYNLYLEILNNVWKVKLVRIYLDYLYKIGRISWEEKERLKSIFRIKKKYSSDRDDDYIIDPFNLIKKVKAINEESLYRLILELLLYSGARLSEIVKMIREWDDKRLFCTNTWCRYRLKWRRGRKRCDYIYFPRHLVEKIQRYAHNIGKYDNIRRNIYEYYRIKEKDFRKLHYRLCRRVLDKEICDFYQSRISNLTIGDIHYDNLLSRADEKYHELLKLIDELKTLTSNEELIYERT